MIVWFVLFVWDLFVCLFIPHDMIETSIITYFHSFEHNVHQQKETNDRYTLTPHAERTIVDGIEGVPILCAEQQSVYYTVDGCDELVFSSISSCTVQAAITLQSGRWQCHYRWVAQHKKKKQQLLRAMRELWVCSDAGSEQNGGALVLAVCPVCAVSVPLHSG